MDGAHGKTAQNQGKQCSCKDTDDSCLNQKRKQPAFRSHVKDSGFNAEKHNCVADDSGQNQQEKDQACNGQDSSKRYTVFFFMISPPKFVLCSRDHGRVMDFVLEVDMETGEVSELLDLRSIFTDYYDMTEKVSDTDPFFWQAGTRDWIHLYTDATQDDGLVLSSRETSTIIKIGNVHSEPELTYLIGDRDFWEGTPYADYVYEKDGDFTGQYGQHAVTVLPDVAPLEGQYYLMMFNNNYYANSTRTDDYEPELDERVSESLQDEEQFSYVDVYLVDENQGTYELVWEMEVPYSSIVSSVQVCGNHLVVNSGVANVFGEYDAQGELIRQYAYECSFQGYRVMKDDFNGFWFAN